MPKTHNPSSKIVATRTLPDGRVISRDALWPELRSRYESGECGIAALVQLYNIPRSAINSRILSDKRKGDPWTKKQFIPPPLQMQSSNAQSPNRIVQLREEHFERYEKRFTRLRELLDHMLDRPKEEMTTKDTQTLIDAERKLHEMERTHLGLDQVQENREGLGDISGLGLFDGANITIQSAPKAEIQAQCVEVESHVTQEPA